MSKHVNEMIASGKPIDRINTAIERQKIRDFEEVLEIIDKLEKE